MIDDHSITTTITISKRRLPPDQRMAAKALLLALGDGALLRGGQLILHFGPGRNPIYAEVQERCETTTERFQLTGTGQV